MNMGIACKAWYLQTWEEMTSRTSLPKRGMSFLLIACSLWIKTSTSVLFEMYSCPSVGLDVRNNELVTWYCDV